MKKIVFTAVAALIGAAAPLSAQDWGSPMFLPPEDSDDLGLYFVNPEDGDFGFTGLWRQSGRFNLGLRAGILDADEVAVILGADASDIVLERGERGIPLDVRWVLGFGATINDAGGGTAIRVPAGLTAGRSFEGEDWRLLPYVVPRVTFLARADDDETDVDLGLNIDLAADLHFGERWLVRGGITLGADDAIGVGAAYKLPRAVEVTAR